MLVLPEGNSGYTTLHYILALHFPLSYQHYQPSSQFSPCLFGFEQMWQAIPLKPSKHWQLPFPCMPSLHWKENTRKQKWLKLRKPRQSQGVDIKSTFILAVKYRTLRNGGSNAKYHIARAVFNKHDMIYIRVQDRKPTEHVPFFLDLLLLPLWA